MTKFRSVGSLFTAHSFNDMYSNYIPALLPFLVLSFGINATKAAILVSVFSLSSSFSQPVFGYFFDKRGIRWLVHIGTLWMAIMLSLTGVFSVTVVATQEAIPMNKSLAAGLSMGFAGGIGSLALIPIGRLADLYGLSTAIIILFSLPLLAGILALFMKNQDSK